MVSASQHCPEALVVHLAAREPRQLAHCAQLEDRGMHAQRRRELGSPARKLVRRSAETEGDDTLVSADDRVADARSQQPLHFVEVHSVAEHFADALEATRDVKVSVRVEAPEVAGPEAAV